QWQLTNLNQGYLLPLDFNAYLKLKRDIAKALFSGHTIRRITNGTEMLVTCFSILPLRRSRSSFRIASGSPSFNAVKNVLFPSLPVSRGTEFSDNMVRNSYFNFGPRLGIAYQLTRNTVLRTGYGIFHGFPDVVNFVPSLNPPSRVQNNLTGNNIDP